MWSRVSQSDKFLRTFDGLIVGETGLQFTVILKSRKTWGFRLLPATYHEILSVKIKYIYDKIKSFAGRLQIHILFLAFNIPL